ncbi:MAG: hypothetical protein SFV18_15265 [Bryobacteraceae bacterium]|nr:hypothetical protein [Bryobacteraceae bacterium]
MGLMAQDLTPAQFKARCETSPNNTFTISTPTKILGTAPAVTAVNTGCRVVFNTGGKIEADQSAFQFAGPLVFQAGPSVEVNLVKSLWTAPSFQITEGASASLILVESTLKATAGNINVALASDGKIDAAGPYAGQLNALEAAGNVRVTGGARSAFSIQSSSVRAGGAFNLSFSGTEANLQLTNSSIVAEAGAISVISTSTFANFDLTDASLDASAGITVSARGNEGKVTAGKVAMNSGTGATLIEAGTGTALKGAVKLAESNVTSGGAVTILASRNATSGEAVVEVSTISAGGAVRIESGNGGTTTALNNGLTSPVSIRVFAPPSGSCVAENNTAVAPVLQLCP